MRKWVDFGEINETVTYTHGTNQTHAKEILIVASKFVEAFIGRDPLPARVQHERRSGADLRTGSDAIARDD